MYFEEPDTAAHAFGPESVQVLHYIEKVLVHLFLFLHSLFILLVNLFVCTFVVYGVSLSSSDLHSTKQ
jgi:hypothetical protein